MPENKKRAPARDARRRRPCVFLLKIHILFLLPQPKWRQWMFYPMGLPRPSFWLTEFEKIEIGNYSRVYTIGNVRRENQYSIADKEGFYNTRVGEHLGYRYLIRKIIDKGSFGQVVCCTDLADPNERIVAAKIGKNKKFDVDNANVEIRLLEKLRAPLEEDNEGHDCLVHMVDSFRFRQHVIIIFACLSLNLYKYQKLNKRTKQAFNPQQLKTIAKQVCQGLKFMKMLILYNNSASSYVYSYKRIWYSNWI